MSGRLLTFSQYLGGADNVKVIEMFRSTTKTFKYDFGTNVTGWDFDTHYQTLLLDKVTYDRNTGEPNFTDTNILGYWQEKPGLGGPTDIRPDGPASNGTVLWTLAPERYTGQLFPNARENVVMTVASMTWMMPNDGNSGGNDVESHRWGIIERYLPGDHTPGDPALDQYFIPYGVGAVLSNDSGFSLDYYPTPGGQPDEFVYDTQFRFTDNDTNSPDSNGTGFTIGLTWTRGITDPNWGVINAGRGYRPGDVIRVSDEALGNGGSGETVITVGQTS